MSDPNTPAPPSAPTAPAPPNPTTPTPPGSPPVELTAPSGTALQIAQLLAAGKIDTTQAGKLSRAGNISTQQVAQALHVLRKAGEPQEPERSPEVKQLDAQFPPGKPEEFVIRYGEPGREQTMTPELKAFDQSARAWLSGAGFPRDVGNSLINAIGKVVHTTKDMMPDQLEQYGYAEFAKLEQAHGPALQEKLQAAAEMIHELDQKIPGLKNLLRSKGLGDNALVASMLMGHATIFHARKGRR